jgi:hypothetical protein
VTCAELFGAQGTPAVVELERFAGLPNEGRHLVATWLGRAWKSRDARPESSFEPLIFTWISFNGWAACVSDRDQDAQWIAAIGQSPALQLAFRTQACNSDSSFRKTALAFGALWPIFKAQELRHLGILSPSVGGRAELIEYYLRRGATKFEPQCWKRHRDAGEEVPIDWPHTLKALYRVRCNLFHGEKAVHSEMDQTIVHAAFLALVDFLHHSGLIEPASTSRCSGHVGLRSGD